MLLVIGFVLWYVVGFLAMAAITCWSEGKITVGVLFWIALIAVCGPGTVAGHYYT